MRGIVCIDESDCGQLDVMCPSQIVKMQFVPGQAKATARASNSMAVAVTSDGCMLSAPDLWAGKK